jgi:thioredoxin 1
MYKSFLCLVLLLTLVNVSKIEASPPIFTNNPEDAFIMAQEIDLDILLVFGAKWCPACVVMKNDIHKNLDIVNSTIVCYVDFEERPDMVLEYQVKVLPDYMIYRNKKEIKRKTGYNSKEEFRQWMGK